MTKLSEEHANSDHERERLTDAIRQALSQIMHPEIQDQDILTLGMVPEINITDQSVTLTLAFPFKEIPPTAELPRRVEKAAHDACPSGMTVKVDVRQMTPEERSAFSARAQGREPATSSRSVRHVLAVMSGKGGVGKSSVAALLACAIHRRGEKVGVLDADITGPSIPRLFGTHSAPYGEEGAIQPPSTATGIKLISVNLLLPDENQPVVWRGPLIGRAIQQFWSDIAWGDLDYLIVDLPPGTSDAALTVMQSLPVHGVVLVTSPQDLAGMVVRKAANMAKRLGVRLLGLVENMSYVTCPQCGQQIEIFGPSRTHETALQSEVAVLGSLPLDPELAIMCDQGQVENYRSEIFEAITEEVLQRIAAAPGGAPTRPSPSNLS
jgi:Mrp family chromosome partitioning ATPase